MQQRNAFDNEINAKPRLQASFKASTEFGGCNPVKIVIYLVRLVWERPS